jgi:predicted nucleic acid-binding protein
VILPDSSAWIEFLRASGSAVDQRLTRAIESGEETATTGPVMMEVLAGARDERHAGHLARLLARCRLVQVEQPSDFETAAAIHRTCRGSGRTVRRLPDCLIAAVVIREGLGLLHADSDFDSIAACTSLASVDPMR